MSLIRIEYCVLGGNAGRATDAGNGIIQQIVATDEKTATSSLTVQASYLTVPAGATHVIAIGMAGNTLIAWDAATPLESKAKLVREGEEIAFKVNEGDKLAIKERA